MLYETAHPASCSEARRMLSFPLTLSGCAGRGVSVVSWLTKVGDHYVKPNE